MEVRVTSDPVAFEQTVFPFLQQDPVLHTIIMTNVHERAAGAYRSEREPGYYVSVHDGEVVGAAMRTQARPVYLGGIRPEYAEVVADAYLDLVPELGGVAGNREAVTRFADRWLAHRGGTATETKATRLHKLETPTTLTAEGAPRLMKATETELVAAWSADGFGDEFSEPDLEWAELNLKSERMWIWEADGEPVSMVGYHHAVFGVCRVGPVYTPPEHRRHGYAGALTSHVSAVILAQGNQACLYTDLANPTSNKIYHQAGYRPVADFVDVEFTP
jgi:GNAT superfamily N-acetyltransferase